MTLQQTIARRTPATASVRAEGGWGFLEFFVIFQVIAPALLFLPGTQMFRVPLRTLPFALSLFGLIFILREKENPRVHPVSVVLFLILAYVSVMVLHPATASLNAGIAHVAMYAAIAAPVFWVPYLVRSDRQVFRVLAILLICNGINSVVGVLQVINPDRFLPQEYSTIVEAQGGPLGYVTDEGKQVIRPPGLSDNPGAVCGPATTAALLGFIALTLKLPTWMKGLSLGISAAGVAAIFLSHVRTNILILGGMVLVYALVLFLQRETRRGLLTLALAGITSLVAFSAALALGGREVASRFASLLEEDPVTVYYYRSARGHMTVEDTARHIVDAPLGSGLARWGMMRNYFGSEDNPRSTPIWAEVQFVAWALDGGLPMILLYPLALLMVAYSELNLALRGPDLALRRMAAIIFAANLGVVALVLSYTPFMAQIGVMYWLMAGLLHGAMLTRRQRGAG